MARSKIKQRRVAGFVSAGVLGSLLFTGVASAQPTEPPYDRCTSLETARKEVPQQTEPLQCIFDNNCQNFDQAIKRARDAYLVLLNKYKNSGCLIYDVAGAFAYKTYYQRRPDSQFPSWAIVREYDQVLGSLRRVQAEGDQVVRPEEDPPAARLKLFEGQLQQERGRLGRVLVQRDALIAGGVLLTVVGAGLLGGGIRLLEDYRQLMPIPGSSCPVAGVDGPCVEPPSEAGRYGLTTAGAIVMAAGVGTLIGLAVWLPGQKTPQRALPVPPDAPGGSKDVRDVKDVPAAPAAATTGGVPTAAPAPIGGQ